MRRLPRSGYALPRSDIADVALCHSEEAVGRRENLSFGRLIRCQMQGLPRRVDALFGVTEQMLHHVIPSVSEESVRDYFHCFIYPNQILHFVQNDISIGLVFPRFLTCVRNDTTKETPTSC